MGPCQFMYCPEIREAWVRAGCVDMIILSMRQDLRDMALQHNGAWNIAETSQEPAHRKAWIRAGAVELLVAVLEEHCSDRPWAWGFFDTLSFMWPVFFRVVWALRRLAEEREARDLMLKLDVMRKVKNAAEFGILGCFEGHGWAGLVEHGLALSGTLDAHAAAAEAAAAAGAARDTWGFVGAWISNESPSRDVLVIRGTDRGVEMTGHAKGTLQGEVRGDRISLTLASDSAVALDGRLASGRLSLEVVKPASSSGFTMYLYPWRAPA